jgi:CheY-like chemotaxis protein
MIDSKWGEGTSVRLYLPRLHGEVGGVEQDTPQDADSRNAAGEVVLVVEDEPIVRGVILEMLSDQGYRTIEAIDGPSALQILRDQAQRVDLLVTDIGLPGMNGRQLADFAREARPDLNILFTTGYAADAASAKGFLKPGMRMITKPFDLDNLSRMIGEMILNVPARS